MPNNDRVDPVYEYVDKQNKLLKKELQQLKAAHDAVAAQNAQVILELQRTVASLKVSSNATTFCDIIGNNSRIPNRQSLKTEILANASAIKVEISNSNDPMRLATEFNTTWASTLRNLGANFVTF